MKRIIIAILVAIGLAFVLPSCQKAPFLRVNGPRSFSFKDTGGSQTVTFSANRDWKVTSSDSWIRVSPSSGSATDGEVTVTITCEPNTTYDPRNTTLTVKVEELTETLSVSQETNYGIIIPTKSYDFTSDANTIEVEVQTNVQYAVSISDSWIKQIGTKGLSKNTLVFSVSENTTYDNRSASIIIKSQNNVVADQVITVRQAQKDALIVKDSIFNLPYGGGGIEVKVEANIDFEVSPNVEWIHFVQTKALNNSTVLLKIDENMTFNAREGKVEIRQKNGSLSHIITIKQSERIAVTSIELNKTKTTLIEGDTETLVAMVKPDNASDKTVFWKSSDTNVATVDENGAVLAVSKGTCSISAIIGEIVADCSITVLKRPSSTYFSLTAEEDGSTFALVNYGGNEPPIQFSRDQKNWEPWDYSAIALNRGETIYLKVKEKVGQISQSREKYCSFKMTGKIAAGGNILSLRYGDDFVGRYGHSSRFYNLFEGCTSLTAAPELPAMSMDPYGYEGMFRGCINLKEAPELPATTLSESCYAGMFEGCTSLIKAPELPATTLAESCYSGMFTLCTSLNAAPNLPATTIAKECYSHMFVGCTSLSIVPESLPATTLSESCYAGMFEGCTSLIKAPELPATTLADYCYTTMFWGTGLTSAPELPATTLSESCYRAMFGGCSGLTVAPKLPATTLSASCYFQMFSECTSLTTAPELPATTLADNCYTMMFGWCTSLIKAPDLPAKTLSEGCYANMFMRCIKLNHIKMMAIDISAPNCILGWISDVSSNGVFIMNSAATWDISTPGIIPNGWTVEYADE